MMNSIRRRLVVTSLAALAGLAALAVTDMPSGSSGLWSRAEAVIGRPLTPLSYAGVARRTTARVYAAPVYAAPVVVVAPRPGCYQAVNPYGQVYWRCP
jgi:hypothetical protein